MKLLPIIVIASLTSTLIPTATCGNPPRNDSTTNFKWGRPFGLAVMDWVEIPAQNALKVDLDWNAASWGMGAQILLEKPVNLRNVTEIEATVYTNHDSPAKIYAMVATADDANLSFPSAFAYTITSVPQKLTFPIDKFVQYKPDINSKDFKRDDWQRVDRVKFILLKPKTYEQSSDFVIIENPRIIYKETSGVEAPAPQPIRPAPQPIRPAPQPIRPAPQPIRSVQQSNPPTQKAEINKVVRPSKSDRIPDVKYSKRKAIEIPDNTVKDKSGTTHYQSLEDLMNQYPPDDSGSFKTNNGNVAVSRSNTVSYGRDTDTNNNYNKDIARRLAFDKISIFEDSVQDWGTMDQENKFFFNVAWKGNKSGFTINFQPIDPIEASGEWHLIFTAQSLDNSNPEVTVNVYNENERQSPLFSYQNLALRNKWKTFYVPLSEEAAESFASGKRTVDTIDRIDITCLGSDSNVIKEDIIVIRDIQLLKKRRSNRVESFLEPAF